jgi:hypothetical protein
MSGFDQCPGGGHDWDHCARCGYRPDGGQTLLYVAVAAYEQRAFGTFGSERQAQEWIDINGYTQYRPVRLERPV